MKLSVNLAGLKVLCYLTEVRSLLLTLPIAHRLPSQSGIKIDFLGHRHTAGTMTVSKKGNSCFIWTK